MSGIENIQAAIALWAVGAVLLICAAVFVIWPYAKRVQISMVSGDGLGKKVIVGPKLEGTTPIGEMRVNVDSYYFNERHRHSLPGSPDKPILAVGVYIEVTLPMYLERLEMQIAGEMLSPATPIMHEAWGQSPNELSFTVAFDVPDSIAKGKQEVRLWAKAGGKNWPSKSIVIDFDKLVVGKIIRPD